MRSIASATTSMIASPPLASVTPGPRSVLSSRRSQRLERRVDRINRIHVNAKKNPHRRLWPFADRHCPAQWRTDNATERINRLFIGKFDLDHFPAQWRPCLLHEAQMSPARRHCTFPCSRRPTRGPTRHAGRLGVDPLKHRVIGRTSRPRFRRQPHCRTGSVDNRMPCVHLVILTSDLIRISSFSDFGFPRGYTYFGE